MADPGLALVASLRSIRLSWGLSHEDLAELVGVNARTIFKWEARDGLPHFYHLLKWCDALGCDLKAEIRR